MDFTEDGINEAMVANKAAWQTLQEQETQEALDEWCMSEAVLARQLLGAAYLQRGLDPLMAFNLIPIRSVW